MIQRELDLLVQHLDATQLTALLCVTCLAIKGNSTLKEEWEGQNLESISSLVPLEVISKCDIYTPEPRLLELAATISVYILTDLASQ